MNPYLIFFSDSKIYLIESCLFPALNIYWIFLSILAPSGWKAFSKISLHPLCYDEFPSFISKGEFYIVISYSINPLQSLHNKEINNFKALNKVVNILECNEIDGKLGKCKYNKTGE